MHMKMRHGLATIRAAIDDDPKARIVEAFLPGHGLRDINKMAQKRFIGGSGGRDAHDFLFWDDQKMDGGLGIHVVESEAEVVFVGDAGRNFAGDDLGENSAHGSLAVKSGFEQARRFDEALVQDLRAGRRDQKRLHRRAACVGAEQLGGGAHQGVVLPA